MQNNTPQQVAMPPANNEKTDLKEFVRVLVILCNEKIKNFHVNRLQDTDNIKDDLIELIDHFDELFLNTKDLVVYNNKDLKIRLSNDKDISFVELCQLINRWVCLDGYKVDESITTIFNDGADLFGYYLIALIQSKLYEAK
jgi:hypothetical protein